MQRNGSYETPQQEQKRQQRQPQVLRLRCSRSAVSNFAQDDVRVEAMTNKRTSNGNSHGNGNGDGNSDGDSDGNSDGDSEQQQQQQRQRQTAAANGNSNGSRKFAGARATLRRRNLVEGFSTFRWIDCVLTVGYRRFSVLLHNFPTIKY